MKNTIFKLFKLGTAIAVLCLLYGFGVEPKLLKIRHVEIESPKWHGEPVRIVLVSDLHIGGIHMKPARVEKLVQEINALSPDIVLITGDYISGHLTSSEQSADFNAKIENGLSALEKLTPKFGTFSAMGNHDDWYNGPLVKSLLGKANIHVLENTSTLIDVDTSQICLVGLPDNYTGSFQKSAFNSCLTQHFTISFMHSPDSFKHMRADTDLALAGHTHGGQINIPLIGRRVTATDIGRDFAYGKVDFNGIPGFVTAGVGTSILPARFRAPPEIVLIQLLEE